MRLQRGCKAERRERAPTLRQLTLGCIGLYAATSQSRPSDTRIAAPDELQGDELQEHERPDELLGESEAGLGHRVAGYRVSVSTSASKAQPPLSPCKLSRAHTELAHDHKLQSQPMRRAS